MDSITANRILTEKMTSLKPLLADLHNDIRVGVINTLRVDPFMPARNALWRAQMDFAEHDPETRRILAEHQKFYETAVIWA